MFDMKSYALNLLMNNPRVKNNPQSQDLIRVLQSGDERAGIEMADKILKSRGLTREQGIKQAQNGLFRH